MATARRFNPSGEVVAPVMTVVVGQAVIRQRFVAVVVYVKMLHKSLYRFHRFCSHHGIALEKLDDAGSAFTAIGPHDALEALTEHASVLQWHFPLNRTAGARAGGAMPKR